jgi:hypothetical protein
LEPRIFRKESADDGSDHSVTRGGRPTVVIADSGAQAEVLVFPPGEAIGRGTEFQYRGTTWIVTGRRRDSGVLVAEPAAH